MKVKQFKVDLRKRAFLTLLLFIFSAGVLIHSANVSAENTPLETLKIAIPPIYSLSEKGMSGIWQGKLIMELNKLEKGDNFKLKLGVYPFLRVIAMIKQGNADLGVYISNPERDKFGERMHDLFGVNYWVVVNAASQYQTIEKLRGRKIGAYSNSSAVKVTQGFHEGTILNFNSHVSTLKALLFERADAIVMPDFRFVEAINSEGIPMENFRVIAVPAKSYMTLYGSNHFKKKNPEIFKQIKEFDGFELKDIVGPKYRK